MTRTFCQAAATWVSVALTVAIGPVGASGGRQQAAPVLRLMTHDSFAVSDELLTRFEAQHGVDVQILLSGDAGSMLSRAVLAGATPLADVLYGVDNTFLSRALDTGILSAYRPAGLEQIPPEFLLDPLNRAIPIDYGDVCVNYDKAYFQRKGIAPPATLEDLTGPGYRGQLVVQNPSSSSPGLAFLLATVARYGTNYLDYWRRLMANDVLVVEDWATAYYQEFSGSSGAGLRPLVVSYGSSPPFEVIYAETPLTEPPTGVVSGPGTCFRQIEFAGILKGTPVPDLARQWMDFMLSLEFQEDLPLSMFVLPIRPDAALQDEFLRYLVVPDQPARLDPQVIAENRERWLREWTQTVLR